MRLVTDKRQIYRCFIPLRFLPCFKVIAVNLTFREFWFEKVVDAMRDYMKFRLNFNIFLRWNLLSHAPSVYKTLFPTQNRTHSVFHCKDEPVSDFFGDTRCLFLGKHERRT